MTDLTKFCDEIQELHRKGVRLCNADALKAVQGIRERDEEIKRLREEVRQLQVQLDEPCDY